MQLGWSGSVVQGGMEKASSGSRGFYLRDYGGSSQFDVDAQVDRVSEFLERDVDFDGWLRNISGDEAEGYLMGIVHTVIVAI
jgi:hypothetical protein